MNDIECVFESMTGKGSIFISNYAAAQNMYLLQNKGIKAILSVARSGLLHHDRQDVPYYLYLPAEDHSEYDIYRFFNQTFDFIEQARRQTNVLVHCMAGVSRSVTIVIAYLLKKFKCSLGEVIMMLQRKRSKINPNRGFIEQLKKYALQEGLKCNFDYEEVPSLRERSFSKEKNSHSSSKEKVKEVDSEKEKLINPLVRYYREKQIKKAEQTAASKSHVKQQKETSSRELNAEANSQGKSIDKSQKLFKIGFSPLKKRCSYDRSRLKNSESIEQKIIKVRQKIMLRQKKKSAERSPECKQISRQSNPVKLPSPNRPSTSNHLTQYFSLYSKSHPINLKIQEDRSNSKRKRQSSEQNQAKQFEVSFCQTEAHTLPQEFRVELYSKTPKKSLQCTRMNK